MKRIVLGYDASPAAGRALERVVELASVFDAAVLVVSVAPVHELVPSGAVGHFGPTSPLALHEQIARDAAARLGEQGIAARPMSGLGGASETLIGLADASDADLIVVGMSTRELLTRVFGGVSDEIAHEAHCDVLLVH